jgi:hypothetical protein
MVVVAAEFFGEEERASERKRGLENFAEGILGFSESSAVFWFFLPVGFGEF